MNGQDHAIRSLLSIDELADHLGVSVRHVRRLVSERRLPVHNWDRLLRFDLAEVNHWLESIRSPRSTTSDPTGASRSSRGSDAAPGGRRKGGWGVKRASHTGQQRSLPVTNGYLETDVTLG
jgi:excisionase family DNA binding protein